MIVNGTILNPERDIEIGQKRKFNESNKVFTIKEKTYDDRDFYTCILENGKEETHSESLIRLYSSIIN